MKGRYFGDYLPTGHYCGDKEMWKRVDIDNGDVILTEKDYSKVYAYIPHDDMMEVLG